MSRSTAAFVFVFLCISRMSADPQNAIKGLVTDSEGAVIAKARVRYRFLIPFLGVSSSTTQCFGSALARDQKTFVVMFDLPSAGIYHASRRPSA
jgi:hypothetical protein